MLLSDVEGLLEIVGCVGPCQLVEFYQVRSARHEYHMCLVRFLKMYVQVYLVHLFF